LRTHSTAAATAARGTATRLADSKYDQSIQPPSPLKQHDLLPQTVLALAQRINATANSGDILADGQVEAFDKRRLDLPATRG
jgi:hypothetical protein